jgi:hypothetical protein
MKGLVSCNDLISHSIDNVDSMDDLIDSRDHYHEAINQPCDASIKSFFREISSTELDGGRQGFDCGFNFEPKLRKSLDVKKSIGIMDGTKSHYHDAGIIIKSTQRKGNQKIGKMIQRPGKRNFYFTPQDLYISSKSLINDYFLQCHENLCSNCTSGQDFCQSLNDKSCIETREESYPFCHWRTEDSIRDDFDEGYSDSCDSSCCTEEEITSSGSLEVSQSLDLVVEDVPSDESDVFAGIDVTEIACTASHDNAILDEANTIFKRDQAFETTSSLSGAEVVAQSESVFHVMERKESEMLSENEDILWNASAILSQKESFGEFKNRLQVNPDSEQESKDEGPYSKIHTRSNAHTDMGVHNLSQNSERLKSIESFKECNPQSIEDLRGYHTASSDLFLERNQWNYADIGTEKVASTLNSEVERIDFFDHKAQDLWNPEAFGMMKSFDETYMDEWIHFDTEFTLENVFQ